MFEESEIVSLALAIPLSVPIVLLARAVRTSRLYLLVGAVIFALAATIFTVVENIAFRDIFNLLEHICYATTGILIAAGCWRLALYSRRAEEGL